MTELEQKAVNILIEAMKTAGDQACNCCDSAGNVRCHCDQAIDEYNKLLETPKEEYEGKFKIGEIVRYSNGATALMRITGVSRNHGGFGDRFYGVQFYGDSMGAYESDCSKATPEEIKRFETDDHIGRLRDYGEKLNPKKVIAKEKI